LRNILAESDAERCGLSIADLLVAPLIDLLEIVIGVVMHRSHVPPLPRELFNIHGVSEVSQIHLV
jgi:hypothetical protein